MARPSVTLPPALLMKSVIGLVLSLASSRSRSMQARAVSFDVADQVDVAEAIAGLLPQLRANGVDELGNEVFVQLTHRGDYRIDGRAQGLAGTK
jgi:hypothetical protein